MRGSQRKRAREPSDDTGPSVKTARFKSKTITRRRKSPEKTVLDRTAHIQEKDLTVVSASRKQEMKDSFMPWITQTYGDTAKTKTISESKAARIIKILRGEDLCGRTDSSKFRFWVRSKGFRLGPLETDSIYSGERPDSRDQLYVAVSSTKNEAGQEVTAYKKVALVENFFDIIYGEHVAVNGKLSNKHAGQKRTYKGITEVYAFLPREAVTRFLLQCAECQRKRAGAAAEEPPLSPPRTPSHLFPLGSPTPPTSPKGSHVTPSDASPQPIAASAAATAWTPRSDHLDLSLPLTATLLKHAQLYGITQQQLFGSERPETCFSSYPDATGIPHGKVDPCLSGNGMTTAALRSEEEVKSTSSAFNITLGGTGAFAMATAASLSGTASLFANSNGTEQTNSLGGDSSSATHRSELQEDYSPSAHKDDDDDDDDDNDDKIDFQAYDPERLKAFNMFVRLFVDENLDRAIPISRQPREKVQAIIDSCIRQFPEFGERARKRIRTYLKSCRRNKRSRDSAGLDSQNRPMPPHLTSAAAEQILAQACENENQNAKRIRMGLEPISQPLPNNPNNERAIVETSSSPLHLGNPSSTDHSTPVSSAHTANSSSTLFRPAFGPYQRHSGTSATSTNSSNGPTDLSTKPKSTSIPSVSGSSTTSNNVLNRSSPLPHKLNAAELLAVRQLIVGYRESAAFLLRSAEELEQLLLQQRSSS